MPSDSIVFSEIDDSNRSDHYYLSSDDKVYFIYEYTSRKGFDFSSTNQLILNLKKNPSKTGTNEWPYKLRAIRTCAHDLSTAINQEWIDQGGILVPVPPSRMRGDSEYDDRIVKVCQAITPTPDVREIIIQTENVRPFHSCGDGERPRVQELLDIYEIDENAVRDTPKEIAIVDDVLTNGTHFRAMSQILSDRFPNVKIYGFFVARRVFPPIDFDFSAVDLS